MEKMKANITALEVWVWRVVLFLLSVVVLGNLLSGDLIFFSR